MDVRKYPGYYVALLQKIILIVSTSKLGVNYWFYELCQDDI